MFPLVDQAEALERRLWVALDACFVDHPHLDRVPAPGSSRKIRRVKRMIERARRRVNRRKTAAGIYIPIGGALAGLIDSKDSSWF